MLTHEKNTLAALFLQKKMKCLDVSSEKKSSTSSLFLENKNASVFWRDQEALHFLSRNTETMITEEMLVRLSISSGNMLIFFWRNDEVLDFFWSNNLSRTLRKHAISNSWISILRLDNSHFFLINTSSSAILARQPRSGQNFWVWTHRPWPKADRTGRPPSCRPLHPGRWPKPGW